ALICGLLLEEIQERSGAIRGRTFLGRLSSPNFLLSYAALGKAFRRPGTAIFRANDLGRVIVLRSAACRTEADLVPLSLFSLVRKPLFFRLGFPQSCFFGLGLLGFLMFGGPLCRAALKPHRARFSFLHF